MNKTDFVEQLRATAEQLKPLTQSASSNAPTWNGKEYVKAGVKTPDPYALAWWSSLNAIAELLDAQETPLNDKQIAYLDGLLFGGMGSLNDLSFDPKIAGADAAVVNAQLDRHRHALFASFK